MDDLRFDLPAVTGQHLQTAMSLLAHWCIMDADDPLAVVTSDDHCSTLRW
jgi:hypothetical protein